MMGARGDGLVVLFILVLALASLRHLVGERDKEHVCVVEDFGSFGDGRICVVILSLVLIVCLYVVTRPFHSDSALT